MGHGTKGSFRDIGECKVQDKTADTIMYYNNMAKQYTQDTQSVDFTEFQNVFLAYLQPGALILDLGCGSGRDSRAFLEKGFRIVAVDGSEELAMIAAEYIGQEVVCETFQQYTPANNVDAIWACASLLHLPEYEIKVVIAKLTEMLNPDGVFYMSFKHGDFSGLRNERYFTDLTSNKFKYLIKDIWGLKVVYENISTDVRAGRENEQWLNVILRKSK
jgi:2-polyprenyl-3-methyl-5-hydroxy-6-metoxy-1,4-benzoquinol methylase